MGAFNFSDSECHGGCFIDEPVVEMNYEFDFDYYDEADAEYESTEYILEYNREKSKKCHRGILNILLLIYSKNMVLV